MEEAYKQVVEKTCRKKQRVPPQQSESAKRKWYKIGKALLQGNDLKLHKESKVAARRTYIYYSQDKGNWNGLSARQLSKMNKVEFERKLGTRMDLELPNEPEIRNSTLNMTMDEIENYNLSPEYLN
jgi:hypothetical protein